MKHATYILMFAGFLVLAGFSCRTDSNHAGIPTEIQKEAKPWAYWWWMEMLKGVFCLTWEMYGKRAG